jgi:hypothetical protein
MAVKPSRSCGTPFPWPGGRDETRLILTISAHKINTPMGADPAEAARAAPPDLVAGRVTCFDRNFPGYDLITAILHAGGHVIARVKEDISLGFEDGPSRGWLPGDGTAVSETCTVITTLLNHRAAPAGQVRDTYLTRWSASETTLGEDKATIAGAGNRTSGPVLRSTRARDSLVVCWHGKPSRLLPQARGIASTLWRRGWR